MLDLDRLRRLTRLHQQSSFARVDIALADHVRHGNGHSRAHRFRRLVIRAKSGQNAEFENCHLAISLDCHFTISFLIV